MKKYILLLSFFFILRCANNNLVYWCGDHPCINKKEREDYFKKTLIVEVKNQKDLSNKDVSEIEKLLEQAKIKQKNKIMNEKKLAKQAKIREKNKIKEEKKLAKKNKILKKEKKIKDLNEETINKAKKEADLDKNIINITKTLDAVDGSTSKDFNELVEGIMKRNKNKPYPDINSMQN